MVEALKIYGLIFLAAMFCLFIFFYFTPWGRKALEEMEERKKLEAEERERELERKQEEEKRKRELLKDKKIFLIVRSTGNINRPAQKGSDWSSALIKSGVRVSELEPGIGTAIVKGLDVPELEDIAPPETSLILKVVFTVWVPNLGGYSYHQYDMRVIRPEAKNREICWSFVTEQRNYLTVEQLVLMARDAMVEIFSEEEVEELETA